MNSQVILIIAAIATVYIVLGILQSLRTSADDSLHPALGGRWSAVGAGAVQCPVQPNRPDRDRANRHHKNAIMMVDFALEAQRHGNLTPQEAIFQACLLRFRPIMMTTLAALFGALPLVLSGGDGSELRQPLGITIVGGAGNEPAPYAVYHAGSIFFSTVCGCVFRVNLNKR